MQLVISEEKINAKCEIFKSNTKIILMEEIENTFDFSSYSDVYIAIKINNVEVYKRLNLKQNISIDKSYIYNCLNRFKEYYSFNDAKDFNKINLSGFSIEDYLQTNPDKRTFFNFG